MRDFQTKIQFTLQTELMSRNCYRNSRFAKGSHCGVHNGNRHVI